MAISRRLKTISSSAAAALLLACDDSGSSSKQNSDTDAAGHDASAHKGDASVAAKEQASAFSLRFAYTAGERVLSCGDTLTDQGSDGKNTVDINDLRFFVSDLHLLDKDGSDLELVLDENDFQLHHDAGFVSLVDLTSNEVGGCTADAFPNSEGTKRVHEAITGMTPVSKVASVRFNVGVPQAVMKKAIQETSAEGQPSPLGDLQWPWSVGWRHFVLNFALENNAGESGIGFVHLGSLDCSAEMTDLALSDRDECSHVNNPAVALDDFSLNDDVIAVDIPTILKTLDFVDDIYDDKGNVTGQGPGVGCHSIPSQPDCPHVFDAFGMSLDTGKSEASKNTVFHAARH